jgi:hypothetical protein
MKNVELNTTGSILTIKVDLSKTFGASRSGKTVIIATTEGNVVVDQAQRVSLGLNVYKPTKDRS